MGNETEEESIKRRKTYRKYEMYWCTTICTVSRVKQFEMQGYYHTTVEMYRDTSNRRNIQKQVGTMQENMGAVINHLRHTKENKKQKKAWDDSGTREIQ
jgi:hypothetical protein